MKNLLNNNNLKRLTIWVIVNSFSIVLGVYIWLLLWEEGANPGIGPFIIGSIHGVGQVIMLKATVNNKFLWIIVTGIGWEISYILLSLYLTILNESSLSLVLNWLIVGAIYFAVALGGPIGLLQWLVGFRKLSKGFRWFWANIIGYLAGAFVLSILFDWPALQYMDSDNQILQFIQYYKEFFIIGIASIVLSTITGIFLGFYISKETGPLKSV